MNTYGVSVYMTFRISNFYSMFGWYRQYAFVFQRGTEILYIDVSLIRVLLMGNTLILPSFGLHIRMMHSICRMYVLV